MHGDLIGGLAAKLSGIKNIIWNVRYSNLEIQKGNLINLFSYKNLGKTIQLYSKIYYCCFKKAPRRIAKILDIIKKSFFFNS